LSSIELGRSHEASPHELDGGGTAMDDSRPSAAVVGIVSPNPGTDIGGVERFANLLADALTRNGLPAETTSASIPEGKYSLVVTSGGQRGPKHTPRVHVYHGCWPAHMLASTEGTLQWRLKRLAQGGVRERNAGRHAERVAVSHRSAQEVRRWYGLRHVATIPNGVDCATFQPQPRAVARRQLGIPDSTRMALFVGRPESRKRPQWALRAASALGLTLHFAGAGTLEGAVPLGALDRQDLAAAYSAADLVLAPTAYEGCSFAILEALACRAALVTTKVGWTHDLCRTRPAARRFTSPRNDFSAFQLRAEDVLSGRADDALLDTSDYIRASMSIDRFADEWLEAITAALRS
jgi:glycosyltransferase involved in cell wall biosynthesis